jgi:hypothetical protein
LTKKPLLFTEKKGSGFVLSNIKIDFFFNTHNFIGLRGKRRGRLEAAYFDSKS